jgi:hypothetical protein
MPCSFGVRQRAIICPPPCSFRCPLTVFVDEVQNSIRASSRRPCRVERWSKRLSYPSWLSDQNLSKENKDSCPNLGWQSTKSQASLDFITTQLVGISRIAAFTSLDDVSLLAI